MWYEQLPNSKSRDSSVIIETGYGLQGRSSIPARGKIFLLSLGSRPAVRLVQPPIS
jgi:hypothetical protein